MNRTRRRRRGGSAAVFEREAEFEFQIAPMADLLFVLLVFFMSVTSVDALRRQKPVALPTAVQAGRNSAAHEGVVTLDSLGNYIGEGEALSDDASLRAWLRGRRQADPALRVVIRADKDCPYRAVAAVMRLCDATHIPDVTFAVIKK
jgi:biopolymer transport protein ExbD